MASPFSAPPSGEKVNPCVRNVLLPMSRNAHSSLHSHSIGGPMFHPISTPLKLDVIRGTYDSGGI
jgi:hypothetical protein